MDRIRRILDFQFAGGGPWLEVVGLARDGKYITPGEAPAPFLYQPLTTKLTPRAAPGHLSRPG